MGSSGSGSLSDYSQQKPKSSNNNDGGSSGTDECSKAFNTGLDEVGRCFYFTNKGDVPPEGTEVNVIFNGVRLSVESTKGEEIGYLPTKYNYLKTCLADGFKYTGVVNSSSTKPIPSVSVDITPA